MPRNVAAVYSKPANTTAVSGQTIESAKYNQTIDDIVDDLNLDRPVEAGGTGASNPTDARANLLAATKRTRSTKAANYTAQATDDGAWFEATAAITLSFAAAATLGNRWECLVFANGGDVTLDPNGAETINGAATLVIPDGDAALVHCTGTSLHAVTVGASFDYTPADEATLMTAGDGVTGGGDLSADRTIALGTPSNITNSTTNSVTADSHTHALGFTAAEVYTGSNANETSLPVGHNIMAWSSEGASYSNARNSSAAVYLSNGELGSLSTYRTGSGAAGTALAGTWRHHGAFAAMNPSSTADNETVILMQRTA